MSSGPINMPPERPILDDPALLEMLWSDMKQQDALHRAGPYWDGKIRNSHRLIRRFGLAEFRDTAIATSFADAPQIDLTQQLAGTKYGRVLPWILRHTPMYSAVLAVQCRWTKDSVDREEETQAKLFTALGGDWLDAMLHEFPSLPRGSSEGSASRMLWRGEDFSSYYLHMLSYIDSVRKSGLDFEQVETVMEIGGGIGANLHLMLNLFPNIKRAVLVDLPPVAYVAGQYLGKFFGKVLTYRETRGQESIHFTPDQKEPEILVITPWQLPQLRTEIDLAWSSHTFAEMTTDQITFYLREIASRLQSTGELVLISYDDISGGALPVDAVTALASRRFAIEKIAAEEWSWYWSSQLFRGRARNT